MNQHTYQLLSISPALPLVYLSHRDDQDRCLQLWHAVLGGMAHHPESLRQELTSLVHASHNGVLPSYLRPKSDELDTFLQASLADLLSGSIPTISLSLVGQILANPGECWNRGPRLDLLNSLFVQAAFYRIVDFVRCC
jgi:hypothetical protein